MREACEYSQGNGERLSFAYILVLMLYVFFYF